MADNNSSNNKIRDNIATPNTNSGNKTSEMKMNEILVKN